MRIGRSGHAAAVAWLAHMIDTVDATSIAAKQEKVLMASPLMMLSRETRIATMGCPGNK